MVQLLDESREIYLIPYMMVKASDPEENMQWRCWNAVQSGGVLKRPPRGYYR